MTGRGRIRHELCIGRNTRQGRSMIWAILRSVVAIALSLMAAMAIIVLVEVVTLMLHPFPPEVDTNDHDQVAEHVAKFPAWILAIATLGWGACAFVAAWIATRLGAGRHPAHGIAIGVLLLMMAGLNMYLLPYPSWFEVGNLVMFPVATLGAVQLGRERPVKALSSEPEHASEA